MAHKSVLIVILTVFVCSVSAMSPMDSMSPRPQISSPASAPVVPPAGPKKPETATSPARAPVVYAETPKATPPPPPPPSSPPPPPPPPHASPPSESPASTPKAVTTSPPISHPPSGALAPSQNATPSNRYTVPVSLAFAVLAAVLVI